MQVKPEISRIGTFNGKPVDEVRLASDEGVLVDIMTYGCVVRDWQVPVEGHNRHVVLGFDTFDPYPSHSPHFGSIAGRVANRIGFGRFEHEGQTVQLPVNEPQHHLHGGPEGLGRQIWDVRLDDAQNAAIFTHTSPDGHMGYPGNVEFTITYRLEGHKLYLEFLAVPDRATPISLVQHHYFNLGQDETVLDHTLWLDADRYTPSDETLLPTGEILSAAGTRYDFATARTLRDAGGADPSYDLNLVLREGRDVSTPAAIVTGPDQALQLKLWTDRPGVQLYDGVWTDCPVPGLGGRRYGKFSGLCLEDQAFPNTINQPNFGSIICTPDRPYRHSCVMEIKPL